MERKLNRINNMSARGTYDWVYHLRRAFGKAMKEGDRKTANAMARLITEWHWDEPTITGNALWSYVNKGN